MNPPIALSGPPAAETDRPPGGRASISRFFVIGSRLLLGLIFFVFGLNGFFLFMPPPPNLPPGVVSFMTGMAATRYFFSLLAGTQTLAGALLLANRFVPLALIILAPVIVNIVAFHLFLAPDGLVLALLVLALELYLAWNHRAAYRSLLVARAPRE